MTIPLHFITRYAVPFLVAALYLQNSDIREQILIFDKTERLADEALSQARKEGEGTETFDYIIVGAGSAGALLANRLTASGVDRVLLLEAGGDPNPVNEVPYARPLTYGLGVDDWGYTTVKQSKGCQRTDGNCPYNRGKALGGSSSVNGLVYNRCKPKDFDLWANFTGDPSWSWDNIWETFNSFEDYQGFYEDADGSRHGHNGEMYVGKNDYLPGIEVMEEALREKGIPIGDINAGADVTYGFAKMEYNIKDGLRWGTYQAFLEPILNRPNLVIYRYAHATKIETTQLGDVLYRADGVTYQRHGVTRTALVNKEVILAGGVVGSPHLLMLSGIGPREHLDEIGIETILDLPVGNYLQDHPGVDLNPGSGGFVVNTTFARDHNTTENVLQFITNGTGPLNTFNYESSDDSAHTTQFMRGYITSSRNEDRSWPEIHVYLYQRYQPGRDRQEFYFAVELVRSSNYGRITLASSDPNDKPVIDPNVFGDPEDVEKMVDGIEVMTDVFLNSEAFKQYGIQPVEGTYPPCEGREGRDYWRCVVEHKSILFFHPTSSCRMGPNSTVAVLDSKMKVFGTRNIRVMDASSMPFVPSGNTNLPAMLMGARGAEIILSGQ